MYKLFLAISIIGAVVAWIQAIRATRLRAHTEATVTTICVELDRMKNPPSTILDDAHLLEDQL